MTPISWQQPPGKQVTPVACSSRASPCMGRHCALTRLLWEAAPRHASLTPQQPRKLQARLSTDKRGWACSHARAASSSASRDVPTCSGCSPLRPDLVGKGSCYKRTALQSVPL